MNKRKVLMCTSVAGPQCLAAKQVYELSEDLASELIAVGFAVDTAATNESAMPKPDTPERSVRRKSS